MATQEEKKTLNIFDAIVFEAFTKLVEVNGYTQYRAVEAALRAFIVTPPEAQVALMSNNADPKEILTTAFGTLDIEQALAKLSPTQRNQILLLAREAARTICRKKKQEAH